MLRQRPYALTLALWMTLCAVALCEKEAPKSNRKPNIVFILADDLGFNDVGFRDPTVRTPRIDALARSGIILDQAYAQPLCTPSRSALLSGRYPFTTGMQHFVLFAGSPYCLPTSIRLLPEDLKDAGYKTHIVGKWHLGLCKQSCRPNQRGFDSYFGFLTGQETYFTKEVFEYGNNSPIYDLWEDNEPYIDNITYSMDMYRARVKNIIKDHDSETPLFLYLTPPTPHGPIMAPAKYVSRYNSIQDLERRTYLGMVSALDYFVGSVVDQLKASRLYDNTFIIFSSDNGGQSIATSPLVPEHSGSNYPLRGAKGSVFEGGTRVTSFVHSPLLKNRGTVSRQLVHLVDWYPTILDMAGVHFVPSSFDGVSQLKALQGESAPQRREIVYNIDNADTPSIAGNVQFAMRVDDYKLIVGGPGIPVTGIDGWFVPAEFKGQAPTGDACSVSLPSGNTTYACLFDLAGDPSEQHNLYLARQDIVSMIFDRFNVHMNRYVQPLVQAPLPFNAVQAHGLQTVTFC